MPKRNDDNRATFWSDAVLDGLDLLKADFGSHAYPPHMHRELVVAVTEAGGADYVSRGLPAQARSDRVMVFNPQEPHASRIAEGQRWRYRAFYFGPAFLAHLSRCFDLSAERAPYFTESDIDDRTLARALVGLHRCMEGGEGLLQRETSLLASIAALYGEYGRPRLATRKLGFEGRAVAAARTYLHENFAADIRVGDLAALAGMGEFHFIRAFRRAVGLPPHAYLNQIRIDEAQRLLRSRLPPAEVAVAVGYYDQSHLNRNFRRMLGITPGQYLRAVTR